MATIPDHEWNKLREAIEVLAGWRRGNPRGKALTEGDRQGLDDAIAAVKRAMASAAVTVPDITSQDAAAATPTGDEFNALRADVVAIHDALAELSKGLAG